MPQINLLSWLLRQGNTSWAECLAFMANMGVWGPKLAQALHHYAVFSRSCIATVLVLHFQQLLTHI